MQTTETIQTAFKRIESDPILSNKDTICKEIVNNSIVIVRSEWSAFAIKRLANIALEGDLALKLNTTNTIILKYER